MLDQSFSLNNFLNIFFNENRKGTLNNHLFSLEYLAKHKEIKDFLTMRPTMAKDSFEEKIKELNDEKFELLEQHLSNVSTHVNLKSFQFKLSIFEKAGKDIYTFNKDAASFFASKQLQLNISKTFKVKQSNRYEMVKQLKAILGNNFPKFLIRTDIKSFYESIPQDKLLKKIDENQLLNYRSKKLIKSLVWQYEAVKDKLLYKMGQGVPRGIGISAYLSELYMRDIDRRIGQLNDIVYYARYVDDIVMIFVPTSENKLRNYIMEVKTLLLDEGLEIRDGLDGLPSKTFELNFFKTILRFQFDFLGYKFVIENNAFKQLRLSENKIEKYDSRLEKIISNYNYYSKYDEKKARKLMFDRMRFLTGNFHLINSKKNIKAGIYYSNILLADDNVSALADMNHLNNLIKKHVSKLSPYINLSVDVEKLKNYLLNNFSFNSGFFGKRKVKKGIITNDRIFYSFNKTEFVEITSCWK